MAYIETPELILGVYGKGRLVYTLGTLDATTNKVPITLQARFYYKYPEYTTQKELQGDGGTYYAKQFRALVNNQVISTWTANHNITPVSNTGYYYYYYDLGTFYVDNPNADGSSFSFTLKASVDMACSPASSATFSSYTTKEVSSTINVSGVTRKATLTVPSTCTVGQTATLSYSPSISGFTYAITYSINGHTGNASTSWSVPQFADTDSVTGTLTLTTSYNGTTIGTDSKTFNYVVPSNYLPTISFDFAYTNLNSGRILAGQSTYSTTISTSSTPSGNIATVTYTYSLSSPASNTLSKSGNVLTCSTLHSINSQTYQDTLTITATDSRGRKATLTKSTSSIVSYLIPQVSWLELYRTGSDKTSGYIKISITDLQGTLTTKSVTATNGSSTISGTLSASGNYYVCTLSGLAVNKQWTITIRIVSSVMTSHSIADIVLTQQLPSTAIPISLYDDGTNMGVAFGMYAQGGGVEFAKGTNLKATSSGGATKTIDAYTLLNGSGGNYLPLSGGTLTGDVEMKKASGDTFFKATRTDTSVSCSVGVESGGTNHGLYSHKLSKWIAYADASSVYLNGNATTATTATKLGSATVGGAKKPIYLSSGKPTAFSSTVGSATGPVYMNAGTITACTTYANATVGKATADASGNTITSYYQAKPVLLWTNSGATYSTGTVSLTLSNYQYIVVGFYAWSTDSILSGYKEQSVKVGESSILSYPAFSTDSTSSSANFLNNVYRSISVTTSGVTFGNGQMLYKGSVYQNWNIRCVPKYIWGLKR